MNDADARRQTPDARRPVWGLIIQAAWSSDVDWKSGVLLSIGSLSIMYILLCIGWSIFRSAGFPAWRERGVLFALTLDDFLMQMWAIICSWRVIIHPWFATIRRPRRPLICQHQSDPIGRQNLHISIIQLAWQILNELDRWLCDVTPHT
jgi:hypothetical protein